MASRNAHNRHHSLTRDIVCDPAFGFAICTIIYASKSTTMAQLCAFVCALAIVALRFLRRHHAGQNLRVWQQRLLFDDGMSLRVLGTLGLFASCHTLGSVMLAPAHLTTTSMAAMQACSGLLFAVANFMLAASVSGRDTHRHPVIAVLLQAETWMLGGMFFLGLMAGLQALALLPLLVMGYAITLSNIRHARPEHHRHPKLWYAAATLGFAAISPDGWLVFANVLNAICLVALEHRLTPQGLLPRRTTRATAPILP